MQIKCLWIALPLIAGCSSLDTKPSEAAVIEFHRQLNGGDFHGIWHDSAQAMRKSSAEADFARFLGAIRGKLGRVKDSTRTNWRVNATTSGAFMTLTYSTEFDRGRATETFTYRDIDGKPVLNGYNINSAALILN